MVRLYSLLFFYFQILFSFGQGIVPISQTPSFDFSVSSNGLFTSNNIYGAAMFFPSNSYKPIFSNSGIWMVGQFPNGELRSSINLGPTKSDFSFGPLNININPNLDSAKWNRTWNLNREIIRDHRSMLQNPDYVIPNELLDWPGNPPANYTGPLVPFIDWNNNGSYNPEQGDVPVMEGDYTLFSLYNDFGLNRISETDSGLGIEVKQFSYIYYNSDDNKLILLVRLLLTNRNNVKISRFKLGVFTESLLGNGDNNFIRTIPSQNSVVAYNSSGNDPLYGNKVPALGIMTLNRNLAGTMYVTSDNNVVTGFPSSPSEVNNYLSGRWRNGKVLSYGSNGIDGSSSTSFVYPGIEDPNNQSFEWKEENSGSIAGNRNILLRFDSLEINAGQTIEYRYAYQIIPDVNANVQLMKSSIEKTQELYKKGELTSVRKEFLKSKVQVFPTLFFGTTTLTVSSDLPIERLVLTDINGRKIIETRFLDTHFYSEILLNLSSGTYCLQVITRNGVVVKKLISQ